MEVINLTPHDVVLTDDKGSPLKVYKPSGMIARLNEQRISKGVVDGFKLFQKIYGQSDNLPEPVPGRVYIVSSVIIEAEQNRSDLIAPDDFVRDAEGKIIGCKSFWYRG